MPPKVKEAPAPARAKKVVVNHRTVVGQRRRKKTEAKIIESALRVFAEKGPEAPVIDDFIKAAGIARGTFYNYFSNTTELLEATSLWLSADMIESIEREVIHIKDPVLRYGTGIRLWLRKARADEAWCRFVAHVWLRDGMSFDAPMRDIKAGIRAGEMTCANAEIGWDMAQGALRQAMIRMLREPNIRKSYPDDMVDAILQGLGVSEEKRCEIRAYPLPDISRPMKTAA